MVMKALRDGAKGGITKIVLFGFMAMAVGGMMLMDVGGFFRGGVGRSDIAKIGGQPIPAAGFDRTVRITLNRIGMDPGEAYKLGYINQILNGEIRAVLLSHAARDLGIQVGVPRIAQQIRTLVAPMVQPGQNPADVLKQILMSQGMNEAAFVSSLGRDMANGLLGSAIESGLQGVSPAMARDLYLFQNEKRDIEYVAFLSSEQKDLPPPPPDQIASLYEATKEAYAIPETRTLKLVKVNADALKNTLDISDEELRNNYETNIALYSEEAQWTLDQAILDTAEQAEKVRAALDANKALKAAVAEAGASPAAYLGEQDFEKDSLMEEMREQVMAAKDKGDIIGPVESPLGQYVAVVKKISPARTRPFDEVKTEIKKDMMENMLADQHYELANAVDDMLAGGATLEDVKKEIDIAIEPLPVMNRFGQNKDGKDALKDHGDIRDLVLQNGFDLPEGETSAVFESPSGDFLAVNVASVTPKAYRPFEEVKGEMEQRWMNDQRHVGNQVRVMQAQAALDKGETLKDIATAHDKSVQSLKAVTASGEPKAPLDQASVYKLFEAAPGTPVTVNIEGGLALAVVTDVNWPDTVDEKSETFKTLMTNLGKNTGEEAIQLYINRKAQEYGVKVNAPLIETIYGPQKDGDPGS